MNRRRLLAATAGGIVAGGGGCLESLPGRRASESEANVPSDDENGTGTEREPATAATGLRFGGVYAAPADRDFINGEYLLLENVADRPVDVSGCVVAYPSDRTYRLDDLVLESGAQLVVLSRSGDDSILASSPPAYLRYAGFDVTPGSVLGERGTVSVRNPRGERIATATYENFGCDGGTATDGSGNDLECLH